ncbi:MAG: glycosylhydrolase-like jelly roll fold domain-containing protein, partial [bacterium]
PFALDDNWEVRFAPGWGAPESIHFDRLVPWNTHENSQIKYFSGTATYRKTIELTAEQADGLLRLRLGKLGCIARVRLNGKEHGVVWTAPWTIDLTDAARQGGNLLEIDVANVWQNRLIGDAGLPEEQRRTKTNVILEEGERTRRFRCSSVNTIDELTPSGLLGPVRLEFGEQKDVKLDECREN